MESQSKKNQVKDGKYGSIMPPTHGSIMPPNSKEGGGTFTVLEKTKYYLG